MEIKLKKISLRNFKGISNYVLVLDGHSVNICGRNETGKTSLLDAYLWLITGKDSASSAEFSIKTIDSAGNYIPRLEHEVSAELEVNGSLLSLKRILKEKWSKPRGSKDEVFVGHETSYFWNDVPVSQTEYNNKINSEICPPDVFQILSNPSYFLSLSWQQQRKILFSLIGDIEDSEIAAGNSAWERIIEMIAGKKTLDEYRREVAMRKRKVKEEISVIPARIDEVQRSMPEMDDGQMNGIDAEIEELMGKVQKIKDEIVNTQSAYKSVINEYKTARQKMFSLTKEKENIESKYAGEILQKINALKAEKIKITDLVNFCKSTIQSKDYYIRSGQEELNNLQKRRDELKSRWHELNIKLTEEPSDISYSCPTCGRPYDQEKTELMKIEAIEAHKKHIQSLIEENVLQGRSVKSQIELKIEAVEKAIKEKEENEKKVSELLDSENSLNSSIQVLQKRHENIEFEFSKDPEHIKICKEIETLNEFLKTEPALLTESISSMIHEKDNLLNTIRLKQSIKEKISSGKRRIVELLNYQKVLNEELAANEMIENQIQLFVKAKIDLIQERINSMFTFIKFKMYNEQINGEQVETCEATINGVPYRDVNHAGKINAGLDVINTLSRHFGISLPVWIDNAEAVNNILPVTSQLLKLYVTEESTLTIIRIENLKL